MFICFVFGVHDSRAVRGLISKASEQVKWSKRLGPKDHPPPSYAYNIGRAKRARPTQDERGRLPRQWGPRWPKVSVIAELTRQARFVAGEDGGATRPSFALRGNCLQPRVERQYTFHQNYLGLFTFQFAFEPPANLTKVDLNAIVAALSNSILEFRIGRQRPGPCDGRARTEAERKSKRPDASYERLRSCGPLLADLHALSGSKERYDRSNRSGMGEMPEMVFIHDQARQIEDWQEDRVIECQKVGRLDVFALRPIARCSTQSLQSYIAAHLMEGYALHEMAHYVAARGRALKSDWQWDAAERAIRRAAKARAAAQEAVTDPAIRRMIHEVVSASHCRKLNTERRQAVQCISRIKTDELRARLEAAIEAHDG